MRKDKHALLINMAKGRPKVLSYRLLGTVMYIWHKGLIRTAVARRWLHTIFHEVWGINCGSIHHIGWRHFHLTPHGNGMASLLLRFLFSKNLLIWRMPWKVDGMSSTPLSFFVSDKWRLLQDPGSMHGISNLPLCCLRSDVTWLDLWNTMASLECDARPNGMVVKRRFRLLLGPIWICYMG